MEGSVGVGVGVGPSNIEKSNFAPTIENYLLTCIVSPSDFLTFLKVHLLSASAAAVQKVKINTDTN